MPVEPRVHIEELWSRLEERGDEHVIYARGEHWSAARLMDAAVSAMDRMTAAGVRTGTVVGLSMDQTPDACAALLAAMRLGAVSVVIGRRQVAELPRLCEIACVERVFDVATQDITTHEPSARNELLDRFLERGHAGLVVFTSGSTGAPKAILHDFERVLEKFREPARVGFRTLLLMPLHHMGGVNTFLGALHRPSGLVAFTDSPGAAAVARTVVDGRVNLLPATPSFLNLLLALGPRPEDFASVELITYGAEVMPEALLARVRVAFPNAKLRQTYALTEIGALPKMEPRPDGLWIRLDDKAFELRVRDGLLHLRSKYAMVGYLNAPDPFDADGWLNTGDAVLVDGDWIRVLGRASDLINVGGEKVFPAEVEGVLQHADNVVDAACFGEPDPLLGSRVVARVTLARPEDKIALRQRLRAFCLGSLDRYKVPMRFEIVDESLVTDQLKKKRRES